MDNTAFRTSVDENMKAEVIRLAQSGWDVRIILSQLKSKYAKLSRDLIREILKANGDPSIKREVGRSRELPVFR